MWFVPGSFKNDVRKHRPVAEGVHILMTDDVSDVSFQLALTGLSCYWPVPVNQNYSKKYKDRVTDNATKHMYCILVWLRHL